MSVAEIPLPSKTGRYRWSLDATSTMLGSQGVEFADPKSVEAPPSGYVVYRLVVAVPTIAVQSHKPYWQSPAPIPELDLAASGCLVALEGTLEQVGFPGEAVASTALWPELWCKPTAAPWHSRGLLVLQHHRRELFQTPIQLDAASLPRWRPFITDYRRPLDDNNE